MNATSILLMLLSVASVSAREPIARDEKINVDFPDEYREAIIRNVAQLYGLNLAMPSEFSKEKTSLTLKDVTWEQIYDLCLYGSGYTYVTSADNVVQIVRVDNDVKAVALLREKLDRETKETQALRSLLAQLANDGVLDCAPEKKDAVASFVRNVNHTPDECLKFIRNARPNQTK